MNIKEALDCADEMCRCQPNDVCGGTTLKTLAAAYREAQDRIKELSKCPGCNVKEAEEHKQGCTLSPNTKLYFQSRIEELESILNRCLQEMISAAAADWTGADEYHEAILEAKTALRPKGDKA